ncbi:hypothetical protein HDU76_002738 [Blyttiomyces sp. JEL0837]|nr:hypothetical protein HDU76_002738 [Blyttiomyces sp. JEL0837]
MGSKPIPLDSTPLHLHLVSSTPSISTTTASQYITTFLTNNNITSSSSTSSSSSLHHHHHQQQQDQVLQSSILAPGSLVSRQLQSLRNELEWESENGVKDLPVLAVGNAASDGGVGSAKKK